MPSNRRGWLTVTQAAAIAGLTKSTFVRWLDAREPHTPGLVERWPAKKRWVNRSKLASALGLDPDDLEGAVEVLASDVAILKRTVKLLEKRLEQLEARNRSAKASTTSRIRG